MSNITKDQVIDWLSAQSVLDIAHLVKDLETKWGVSAAAPVAAAATGAAAAAPVEEKTTFDVILKAKGATPINVTQGSTVTIFNGSFHCGYGPILTGLCVLFKSGLCICGNFPLATDKAR